MILKKIKKHLTDKINTHFIKIQDDSLLHNHFKKGLTHLKIIIISPDFIGKNFIMRHRMIFKTLSEIIKDKIYSITLYTHTPVEWEQEKHKKNHIFNCIKNK